MAYFLPHLHTAYAVDRAIQDETEKLVVIRFGHDNDRDVLGGHYAFPDSDTWKHDGGRHSGELNRYDILQFP